LSIVLLWGALRYTVMVAQPQLMMTGTSEETASLLRRIETGDCEAMSILFDWHAHVVYSAAFRFLHDTLLAEQVLSDVFMEVWHSTPRFHRFADDFSSSIATYAIVRSSTHAITLGRLRLNGD